MEDTMLSYFFLFLLSPRFRNNCLTCTSTPAPTHEQTHKHTQTHTLTYTHIFQPPAATPSMYYRGSTMYLFVFPPPPPPPPPPIKGDSTPPSGNVDYRTIKRKTQPRFSKLMIIKEKKRRKKTLNCI
ncbi:unnamed protein product [Boreogadus saida]